VGAGSLRQAPCPPRQGRAPVGAAGADGAAAERRRPDAALVRRGRVGPVRRRPPAPRRAAVSVGAQTRRWLRGSGRLRRASGEPGRSRGAAPARLEGAADPARAPPLLRLAALPGRGRPDLDLGGARPLLGGDDDALHPCAPHPDRGRLDRRAAASLGAIERIDRMKWNLRLAAAQRDIWKASQLQRMLAERGLVISAGKMSALWSGQLPWIKLDALDGICAVLGCEIGELLIPEPEKVPQPGQSEPQQRAAGDEPTVAPRRRDGRSLPPA